MTNQEKKLKKKIEKNWRLKKNKEYELSKRFGPDYEGIFIKTDDKRKIVEFIDRREGVQEDEVAKEAKRLISKEETKLIVDKSKRNKKDKELAEEYKSSTEIQREKYDSAMDEYFKIDGKIQKQIDAIAPKTDEYGNPINPEDIDVGDIISGSPQLKNLQKNKIKAMKKVWTLSQSGDEDFRDESLDAFGSLPTQDYNKFTPSKSPGVREYTDAKRLREVKPQQIETSFKKQQLMGEQSAREKGFTPTPKSREEIEKSIPYPEIPKKKKYTDDELLRIIAGK